jgi:hypothetical protein
MHVSLTSPPLLPRLHTRSRLACACSLSCDRYLALSKLPTKHTLIATAVMTLGAVIAALKDLTYDPVSYFLVALTNLSTAGYGSLPICCCHAVAMRLPCGCPDVALMLP